MADTIERRISELEKRLGRGEQIIAVWSDEDEPVDGEPMVLISGTDIKMPLSEFTAKFPNHVIMHIVHEDWSMPPLSSE